MVQFRLQKGIAISMINLRKNLASFPQKTSICFQPICELTVLQNPLLVPEHHV